MERKSCVCEPSERILVGLDITTSSVKLIELTESGKGFRVESYAAEPTPPNAINEKAIVDADAVGEAIRRAHKRAGTKTREAAIAISGDAAITKVIQMPKSLSPTDLEGKSSSRRINTSRSRWRKSASTSR